MLLREPALFFRSHLMQHNFMSFLKLLGLVAVSAWGCAPAATAQFVTVTTKNTTYYVAKGGNDNKDCLSPGTACKTIQAALNKVPKYLRHVVTISVGPGTFSGAYIEGFSANTGFSGMAGLKVSGTLDNAEIVSGLVTGTADSCIGGGNPDPNTHASLTKAGAGWTPGNLRGKFLVLTKGTGAGQILAIEDNTEDVITLAGYWKDYHTGWSICDATSHFAIQVPSTHINAGVALPAGLASVSTGEPTQPNWAAFIFSNDQAGASGDYIQAGDHSQFVIEKMDVQDPARAVMFGEHSSGIAARFITGNGMSGGSALYAVRDVTSWSVVSCYSNQVSHYIFAASNRMSTADTFIGMFGNVVDHGGAYFGDENSNTSLSKVSVYFDGESIRNMSGDDTRHAAITLSSSADTHFVGTNINGYTNGSCIRLGTAVGRQGFGKVTFEGGDVSNCGEAGIHILGQWQVQFINLPFTGTGNGRWGVVAANGAHVTGLYLVTATGGFGDFSFNNLGNVIRRADLQAAGVINDLQKGSWMEWGSDIISTLPVNMQSGSILNLDPTGAGFVKETPSDNVTHVRGMGGVSVETNGSITVNAAIVPAKPVVLQTCNAQTEGAWTTQFGANSGTATKMCYCRSDGANHYQWCSLFLTQGALLVCAGGNATTCPERERERDEGLVTFGTLLSIWMFFLA